MNEILDRMRKTLPKYNIKQPSTGKTISFRPFTVREEKILLISNQTGSYEDFLTTLIDIINNCFSLDTNCKTLPLFDIEYFFINLRSKSVGEIIEPTIVCPQTKETIKLQINLENIVPIFSNDHTKTIKVSEDMIVKMKYPSLEMLIENKKFNNDYFDLVIDCIDSIETPSEFIESSTVSRELLSEFINLLTSEQYKKILNFFKTTPKLEHEVKYTTSDGKVRSIVLKGLKDFFQ